MRLSKKSAHRIIVSLGLFAPIVYLFGSLFFGLNGAHGNEIFIDEEKTVASYYPGYSKNLWMYENGSVYTAPYPSFLTDSISLYDSSSLTVSGLDIPYYACILACYDDDFNFVVRQLFSSSNTLESIIFDVSTYKYVRFGVSYPNYEDTAPSEINLSFSSELTAVGLKQFNSVNFSDYTFGQFFAKDNFLEQWGDNVLSDNPVGFAPFATFIKFFDSSLIHGADSQIALMMYGQLYYMLHIMLFDLVYHVLVFIPNLITSVFNKFGGGLNDE